MLPSTKPLNANFSSGPTAKRPGWTVDALATAVTGRSHRSREAKQRLAEIGERSRRLLGIPSDYRIGILPGSDTAAFEAALWTMLGPRSVDVVAFDSFGEGWLGDVENELRGVVSRAITADYGELPDLSEVDPEHDLVFCWNGTTSGVRVPNADWIAEKRGGLAFCDATSAAFAMVLPWGKLDVITWSWQKVLGGEAQHGMIVMSPRAVARLQDHRPPWPLPKVFRLTQGNRLIEGIFRGETINTPSMLAVEDALDGLRWAERIGGLAALIERTERNAGALAAWIERSTWAAFLAADPSIRSPTSVCLKIIDPAVVALSPDGQRSFVREMTGRLAEAEVAFDIEGYRDAPPGLRIWCGATIETGDVQALLPWLDWAFAEARARLD